MSVGSGGGSGTSMLLILSAIDLLSSALICGFLLFVTLVGADTSEARTNSDANGTGDGVTLIEIISRDGQAALKKRAPENTSVGPAEGAVEQSFFGATQLSNNGYLIPADIPSMTVENPGEMAIRVYSPGKEAIEIFFRCVPDAGPILMVLNPLTFPAACEHQAAGDANPKMSAGQTLYLRDGEAFPDLPKPENGDLRHGVRFKLDRDLHVPVGVSIWGVTL